MAIQLEAIFTAGGRPLIDVLTHCVYSINADALFLYLVREYRFKPQAKAAIALHDVFCNPQSPACISQSTMIIPKDWRLAHSIEPFRQAIEAVESVDQSASDDSRSGSESEAEDHSSGDDNTPSDGCVAIEIPPRHLFDHVVDAIRRGPSPAIASLQQSYDTGKTPTGNLPGGELSAVQRAFVDHQWLPSVRPFLVAAGFWRIATIG
ncbi:hypothetical protein U8335_25390 [Roseiconus lacunae]|uniref:hypothetical protein n=1 Tax=Roseiconus lacunae TaxID=2605694 RepID=UPI001E50BE6D|nr:hypothetical protein [Roseiconus lacunae]MCD0463752.1 hypothetical protein [Roseiconus lacunae]WRQ50273.1 hypothetical protein U8335_25390 [Stieleria sp. HD01]